MNSERDRDESVERLLRRSLAGGDPAATAARGDCPDPETLAAWVDGGLNKRELALVEAHASECSRCQALLAAVVQSAPSPAVSGSQETWRSGWGFRWLVPLAATAAAAVILWISVPSDKRPDLPEQASVQLPSERPTPPQQEARAERFDAPAVSAERPGAVDEAKARGKDLSAGAAERDLRKQNAAPAGQPASESLDALSDKAPAAPAAPPAEGGPQSQGALNETAALSRSTPSVAQQGQQGVGRRGGALVEITSPDPSVRWRIRGARSVEHTTNGGTTWEAVPTAVDAGLTAGASPSPLVCWLVGRAGTVLLSTDGRTWQRVPFPEMTDLTAVQASDARTATVTTADGRMFRTTDGGRTWI